MKCGFISDLQLTNSMGHNYFKDVVIKIKPKVENFPKILLANSNNVHLNQLSNVREYSKL